MLTSISSVRTSNSTMRGSSRTAVDMRFRFRRGRKRTGILLRRQRSRHNLSGHSDHSRFGEASKFRSTFTRTVLGREQSDSTTLIAPMGQGFRGVKHRTNARLPRTHRNRRLSLSRQGHSTIAHRFSGGTHSMTGANSDFAGFCRP